MKTRVIKCHEDFVFQWDVEYFDEEDSDWYHYGSFPFQLVANFVASWLSKKVMKKVTGTFNDGEKSNTQEGE